MTEILDQPLDGREDIVLNLDREELYQLMLYAHEQDITLNQLVENILRTFIEEYNNEQTD
jgi:predicted HicB family RNase H-like nuclease